MARRILLTVAAAMACAAASPATARIEPRLFDGISIGDLRLGMTQLAVERFMHAQDDMGVPMTENAGEFDCALFAPSGTTPPRQESSVAIGVYTFGTEKRGNYTVRFDQLPTGPVVYDILYTPIPHRGDWPDLLADATAAFGDADYIKKSRDGTETAYVWCAQSAEQCVADNNDPATFSLYYSTGRRRQDNRVAIGISSGNRGYKLIEKQIAAARRNVSLGQRLFDRCNRRVGLNAGRDPEQRVVDVIGDGLDDSPAIRDPQQIPVGVFLAIGIDPARQFAPGMCFQSGDVFIEDPACTNYSYIAFSWARRMGPSWVLAMMRGGNALTRYYVVISPDPAGGYRQVYVGALSRVAAWRKAGSIPMPPGAVGGY